MNHRFVAVKLNWLVDVQVDMQMRFKDSVNTKSVRG